MLSSRRRAWSSVSTGVLPRLTTCLGPHTACAGLMARILVDNQPVETLHARLIARLDRLGPIAKEVGQFGAVLGREFGCDLIEQAARRPAAELRLGLAEAELLFCRRVAPQSSYLFAYGTLLRVWRQELHACVTAVRSGILLILSSASRNILAYHLTAAGDTERAAAAILTPSP
jgi:hypothetical protein